VLDALGIAIDFREIKKQTKEVVKRLDHQYLNEIPPFDELNPTAENNRGNKEWTIQKPWQHGHLRHRTKLI
jgi:6-pyruvoyl-tetrahydropterin synthase